MLLFVSTRSLEKRDAKKTKLLRRGIEIIGVPASRAGLLSVTDILLILGSMNIASVFVEGGAGIFGQFLSQNAVDKMILFVAPSIFGHGLDAFGGLRPRSVTHPLRLKSVSIRRVGEEVVIEGYLH